MVAVGPTAGFDIEGVGEEGAVLAMELEEAEACRVIEVPARAVLGLFTVNIGAGRAAAVSGALAGINSVVMLPPGTEIQLNQNSGTVSTSPVRRQLIWSVSHEVQSFCSEGVNSLKVASSLDNNL